MIVRPVSLLILISSVVLGLAAAVGPKGKPTRAGGPLPEQPEDSTDPSPSAKPPRDAEKRFEWNKNTSLGDYERAGERNAKWDEPAKKALEMFARLRSFGISAVPDSVKTVGGLCEDAIKAGCDDPLVRYVHMRYTAGAPTRATKETALAYGAIAARIQKTQYSAIRKFYVNLRAAEAFKAAAGKNSPTPPEVHSYRMAATAYLKEALQDKTMPVSEAYDGCRDLLEATRLNKPSHEHIFNELEPRLLANWPQQASIHLLRGDYYIRYAWNARGDGWADTVTEEGWKLFGERLAKAEDALERAWKLDPADARIPVKMINLELGQGEGRDRMELWFQRAMELDPNNYSACWQKAYYLEPKWYGSSEDLLKFGRECVASSKWGGRVPLILVDAHMKLLTYVPAGKRKEYWKQPEVWKDLKAGFDKYFQLCPDANGTRQRCALYAYRCEQWEELNKQLSLLKSVDYDYFGGSEKFEEMKRLAKEHSGKSQN